MVIGKPWLQPPLLPGTTPLRPPIIPDKPTLQTSSLLPQPPSPFRLTTNHKPTSTQFKSPNSQVHIIHEPKNPPKTQIPIPIPHPQSPSPDYNPNPNPKQPFISHPPHPISSHQNPQQSLSLISKINNLASPLNYLPTYLPTYPPSTHSKPNPHNIPP